MLCFSPSRPMTRPLTANCSEKSSSTTVRLRWLNPSSIQRRTRVLLRPADASSVSGGCCRQPAAVARMAAPSTVIAARLTLRGRPPV